MRQHRNPAELDQAIRDALAAACKFDKIDPASRLMVFSKENNQARIYDRLVERKLLLRRTVRV